MTAPAQNSKRAEFWHSTKGSLLIFGGYVLLALVCYGSTLNGGFLVDDWWWADSAKHGGWPPFGPHTIFFRPVASGVFVGMWHLFGPHPFGYRALSLLWLVLGGWGIRAIWNAATDSKSWAGAFAGAAFILWPTHTEAVAWISGFSDLLVVVFGAFSLWAYLRFLRDGKVVNGVLTLLFMVLTLLTKESAVVLPLLVFGMGQVLAKPVSRKTQLVYGSALSLLLTAAYVLIRAKVIGNVIGGYGQQRVPDVLAALRGWKLTVNLCNMYFPVAKQVAIYEWPALARDLMVALILTLAGLMARSTPRSNPHTLSEKRIIAGLLIAGALFSFCVTVGLFTWGVTLYLLQNNLPFKLALPVVFALLGYVLWRTCTRSWTAVGTFLSERKLRFVWVVAAIELYLIDTRWSLLHSLDLAIIICVYAAFVWLLYLARPVHREANSVSLVRLATCCFVASLIAILPSVSLPINMDGQQARFSYLGTMFSILALTAGGVYVVQKTEWRRIGSVAAAVICIVTLESNVLEWAQAGAISRETSKAITKLLPARTIYVVAAPATLGSALVFQGGIDQIPDVCAGDQNSRVVLYYLMEGFMPSDKVECGLVSADEVAFAIDASHQRDLERIGSVVKDQSFFKYVSGTRFKLVGFRPGDHALYVDAEGPHVLE